MSAPLSNAEVPHGFTFAATHCGLKKSRLDLALIISEAPANAAAIFTTNRVQAAPVRVCKAHLKESRGKVRAVIVNSGNANCCTGPEGLAASRSTAAKVARALGCRAARNSRLLHGRDRRAAARRENSERGARSRPRAQLRCLRLRASRPRHHDHGHGPEMGRSQMLASAESRCAFSDARKAPA